MFSAGGAAELTAEGRQRVLGYAMAREARDNNPLLLSGIAICRAGARLHVQFPAFGRGGRAPVRRPSTCELDSTL
jgi:hypothetical protein